MVDLGSGTDVEDAQGAVNRKRVRTDGERACSPKRAKRVAMSSPSAKKEEGSGDEEKEGVAEVGGSSRKSKRRSEYVDLVKFDLPRCSREKSDLEVLREESFRKYAILTDACAICTGACAIWTGPLCNLEQSLRNLDRSMRNMDRSIRNLHRSIRNLDRSIRNLGRFIRNLDQLYRNLDQNRSVVRFCQYHNQTCISHQD